MLDVPATFEVRQAIGGGDCFFDSVAQGLMQLKPDCDFTVKSLREICKKFAQIQSQDDHSWLKAVFKSEKDKIDYYISCIEFSANDIHQKSATASGLGLTRPIWGRSDIEGRIICEELGVKLHVIESNTVKGKKLGTHQIVDGKGSRTVDTVDYDHQDNTVHVMNTGFLHFQPILRIKQDQQTKLTLDNLSDHKDKIYKEKKVNDVMKSHKSPNDEIAQSSYEKNKSAAQTEGYHYQIRLAMLLLLNGKEKIETGQINRFYLGTDMKETPGFGNIVFKCEKENCDSKIMFLHTKHKEKEAVVSKDILLSGDPFNINSYFDNYTAIKNYFSCEKKGNRIFGEDYSDRDCSFIVFTNYLSQFSIECDINKMTVDEDDIINIGGINYYYKLNTSDEICTAILKHNELSQKTELSKFLHKLKLFFEQPNEHILGDIIKQKLQSPLFSVKESYVETVFASVQHYMQEWHRCKGKSHFQTNENRFFEDAARVSIKFDVKEPVDFFTGRTRELEDLHKILQNAGEVVISQTASVTGLGGVGKTELARKYISKYSKEYDDNVIWINAENYVTTTQSFIKVAEDKLGINTLDERGNRKKTQIIVQDVYEHFVRMQRRSLFVFDNSGEYKAYGASNIGIDEFFPSGRDKPHVLITSRDQDWGDIKMLRLDVFSDEEAAEFIRKALKDILDVEESEVKRLAAELQNLPLALTQAVAYIKMENLELSTLGDKRFTVHRYLELFKANAKDLLRMRESSDNLDHYTGTVMSTWQISIAKIRQNKLQGGEEAVRVLNIMSYLAPDQIPVDIIFLTLINDEELRHSAFELLDKYCIVSLWRGKVNVHRLVQQVTRIELEEQGKNEEIIQKTFELLKESFPYGSDKLNDISRKKLLLPHCEVLFCHVKNLMKEKPKYAPKVEHINLYIPTLMIDGYYAARQAKRQKELSEELLTSIETVHGPNHFGVPLLLISLGWAYNNLGNPYKAKELLERALKILEDYHKPNQSHLAATLLNLSNAYSDIGDIKKQKELLTRTLIIQEDVYGPIHSEVAKTLENLGNAHGLLGDHQKQKELLEKALKIQEDHYDPNHFEVAKTLQNLGCAHGSLGDPHKQKELMERALKIQEDYYGPNHFSVAITLVNLASAHRSLGDPYKQKKLLERALKILEAYYGPNHFKVGSTLNNLASAHGSLGDFNKEKELLERALKILEDHYGPNHFQIANTLVNLSSAHGLLGDLNKEKELLERALKIEEDHYGPNHFKIANTLVNLSSAHGSLGDFNKEKELLERAFEIEEDC